MTMFLLMFLFSQNDKLTLKVRRQPENLKNMRTVAFQALSSSSSNLSNFSRELVGSKCPLLSPAFLLVGWVSCGIFWVVTQGGVNIQNGVDFLISL